MKVDGHAFTGRTAFVTGAASGVGRATALTFAARAPASHSPTCRQKGSRRPYGSSEKRAARPWLTCDVTDETALKAAQDEADRAFGRLDAAFTAPGSRRR